MHTFVALDVEIASRTPLHVCAIGAARFENGVEVASRVSLVRTEGRVRYTQIHGLTIGDLRRAPSWNTAWRSMLPLFDAVEDVVAFRAEFDRAAVLSMAARHGVRLPRLHFTCAAEVAHAHLGTRLSLAETLARLNIPYPGTPHEPLSDARAAAAVFLACSQVERP